MAPPVGAPLTEAKAEGDGGKLSAAEKVTQTEPLGAGVKVMQPLGSADAVPEGMAPVPDASALGDGGAGEREARAVPVPPPPNSSEGVCRGVSVSVEGVEGEKRGELVGASEAVCTPLGAPLLLALPLWLDAPLGAPLALGRPLLLAEALAPLLLVRKAEKRADTEGKAETETEIEAPREADDVADDGIVGEEGGEGVTGLEGGSDPEAPVVAVPGAVALSASGGDALGVGAVEPVAPAKDSEAPDDALICGEAVPCALAVVDDVDCDEALSHAPLPLLVAVEVGCAAEPLGTSVQMALPLACTEALRLLATVAEGVKEPTDARGEPVALVVPVPPPPPPLPLLPVGCAVLLGCSADGVAALPSEDEALAVAASGVAVAAPPESENCGEGVKVSTLLPVPAATLADKLAALEPEAPLLPELVALGLAVAEAGAVLE